MTIPEPIPGSTPTVVAVSTAPVIHHLSIKRFRGISELSWHPAEGTNVILGGGDVGKTSPLLTI